MQKIIIYSTQSCGYCNAAKELLTARGLAFEVIDLTSDIEKRRELSEAHHYFTVPMIFIGDAFIGGYTDLAALDASGELSKKLVR